MNDRHDPRGATLVAVARSAIAAATAPAPRAWSEPWLMAPGATFVTLKDDGELRGCIGSLEPRRPLGDDVAYNAYAAAYRDPRFPPVDAAERARIAVEVSLLSPRASFPAASEAEAIARLRPGVDGLVLEYGGLGATFLPQVWESLPDPLEFLMQLRLKAGLPARFWHPGVRLSRYTVDKFA